MENFINVTVNEVSSEYGNSIFLIKIYTVIFNRIKQDSIDPFNISEVSSCLCVSERTLYRRLKEQGLTYFRIKDEIRKKYSVHLLSSQKYTVKELSELLFFSSSSSFIESFKRWHGYTPKKWNTINNSSINSLSRVER